MSLVFLLLSFIILVSKFTHILWIFVLVEFCFCSLPLMKIFFTPFSCELVLGVIYEDPDQARFFLSLSQSLVFNCMSSLLETFSLKPEFHLFLSGKPILWIGRRESILEPLVFYSFCFLSLYAHSFKMLLFKESFSECLPAAECRSSFISLCSLHILC